MSLLPSFRGVGTTCLMTPFMGEGRVFPTVPLTGVELVRDSHKYFRQTPDVTGKPVWGSVGTACASAPRS